MWANKIFSTFLLFPLISCRTIIERNIDDGVMKNQWFRMGFVENNDPLTGFNYRTAFDLFGDDGSPVTWKEELATWTNTKSKPEPVAPKIQSVAVTNDDERSPVELREKSRGLIIEKEQDHIVWGIWGPWSQCSKSCNGGFRTRKRKCVRGPCSHESEDEEIEDCHNPACEDLIHQVDVPYSRQITRKL